MIKGEPRRVISRRTNTRRPALQDPNYKALSIMLTFSWLLMSCLLIKAEEHLPLRGGGGGALRR